MQQDENAVKYGALVIVNERMPRIHPETRAVIDRVLQAHGIPHTETTVEDVPGADWETIFYEVSQAIHAVLKDRKGGKEHGIL